MIDFSNTETLRSRLEAKETEAAELLDLIGIKKDDHNFSVAMSVAALALLGIDYAFGMSGFTALIVTAIPLGVDVVRKLYSSLVKKS